MDVFKEHPNCIFAYTKSNFLKNRILPLEQYINQIYPNNLIARHGNACHSSIAFNIKELPVNYYSPINEHEIRHPADGKLLTDINRIMLLNEIQYQIYIPELTC